MGPAETTEMQVSARGQAVVLLAANSTQGRCTAVIILMVLLLLFLQVRVVEHSFDIIHLLTDQNPIQILVDAIINRCGLS